MNSEADQRLSDAASQYLAPAGVVAGGTALAQLAVQRLVRGAKTGRVATPEELTALRKAMGGKYIPTVGIGSYFRQTNPGAAANAEHGAYVMGTRGKGLLGGLKAQTREAVIDKSTIPPRMHTPLRQTRRGYIVGKDMSPEFYAHELGHATGRHKLHGLRMAGALGKTVAPLAALYTGSQFGTPEDSTLSAALKGGLAGAGTGAVMGGAILPEEIRATVRGLRGLKRIGYNPAQLSSARNRLLRALGTYGLGITALPALLGAASAMYSRAKSKKEQQTLLADSPSV